MKTELEFYFEKARWHEEMKQMRIICIESGLKEDLKWGCPCYTHKGKNVVLIHVFKEYCALLFFKGSLLTDPGGILIQQTENVQAARQIRFKNAAEIIALAPVVKTFIQEAINLEKAGIKVPLKKTDEFSIPEEFRLKLNEMPALKNAFELLTPGRRRAYLLYFSAAKQSKTREARIEKYIPQILQKKGLDDSR